MIKTSIVMTYYKKSQFINKSINSLINQSEKDFEIIIIDDEVSKESENILKNILKLDKRISLETNDKNMGAGAARNKAINLSKGNYIAFCDCDDLWDKAKLETQIKFMENLNLEFSYTSYRIIDHLDNEIGFRKAKNSSNFEELLNSCDIGLSTVIVKKKIFENQNYKFANTKTKEDYILWLLMAKNGVQMHGIDICLGSWRKTKNSLSSSIIQKLQDGYKVYNTYLKYNKIKSLYLLFKLSINYILKSIK